ncbi:MAG: type II secretion system protein [Patescibacteria group bacterium]
MYKRNKGFTLIELLVVVAIVAILATVVLVAMSSVRVKARDARRENDIREIGLAIEMAQNDDQKYPQSATLPASIASSKQIYVASTPNDPKPGSSYAWSDNTGNDQMYCVSADLERGNYFSCSQNGCKFVDNPCL